MTLLTVSSGSYTKAPLLDKGVYTLELTKISPPQVSTQVRVDDRGNEVPQKDYVFVNYTVRDEASKFNGQEWSEIASWTLGMGPAGPAKLRAILEGFLGQSLDGLAEIDPHAIASQHPVAKVVIDQKKKLDGTLKNVTGTFLETIKPATANRYAEYTPTEDEVPF